jgi:nucleoid DNA-binding protein
MKTKLLLIATLFITISTFSQTTKKGYDYYKAASASKKMNKGELIDAMAKDAPLNKRAARTGRNPQTGATIKVAENTKDLNLRKRPGRVKYSNITLERGYLDEDSDDDGILDGDDLILRKRPGRTKVNPNSDMDITVKQSSAQDHNASRSNTTSSVASPNFNGNNNSKTKVLPKRPGRTKYKKTTGTTIFTPPIPTKATDYNSSRSNKSY